MRHALLSLMLICFVSLTVGCAEWVNIPPIPGGAARNDPNLSDVMDVEAEALAVVMQKLPSDGPTRVILPKGSTKFTYARVLNKVGRSTVMPDENAPTTLDVQTVRIRTIKAWVDIQRTSESRIPQLLTVHLKHDLVSGWYLERMRVWRGTVNPNTQPPYFPPSSELPDNNASSTEQPQRQTDSTAVQQQPQPAQVNEPTPQTQSDVEVIESVEVIEITEE